MADEIGAKLVLTAEDRGASSTVQAATGEAKKLTAATDASRDASGRFTGSQKAAEGATKAAGSGIAGLQGNLVKLAGALPGVGETLKGTIEGASGAFEHLGGIAEAVESGPLAAVTAGFAAAAAVATVASEAVGKFADKQDKVTGLDAALAQRGELTDNYREKLQALAGEYGHVTGKGTEWYGVLTRLTQMGADDGNIEQNAEAVKNLAGLLGGDLQRAATIWGRAMNGNFQLLHRYGIEIDKSKGQHEQLAEAMEQVAARGGGQLEAQTRTLHGQFTALEHAVGGLFVGLGNLISRTGVVQTAVGALTSVLRGLATILPKTVDEVKGLTNKLPDLKDEFGHVKGAADETGEEMEDLTGSADHAAGGLGRAGKEADKAKDEFELATEAAKKLREQQDAMGDAQTAYKIALVDSDEAHKKITAEQANRQRAQIRNDGEQAAIKRKMAEQDTVIQEQIDRRFAAAQKAGEKTRERQQAEAEYAGAIMRTGLSNDEGGEIAARSEKDNKSYLLDIANDRRKQAAAIRGTPQQGAGLEQARAQIQALNDEADAYERAQKQLDEFRQKRADETTATQQYTKAQEEANKAIDEAKFTKKTLAVQQQTATVKAANEQQNFDNQARKRKEEDEKRQRDDEIEAIDNALKDNANPRTDAQKQILFDRRRAIEKVNDYYEDRNDKQDGKSSTEDLRKRQLGRDEERAKRDTQESGGGADVVNEARGVQGALPRGAPGSLNEQAIKLAQEIVKNGGKDTKQDNELIGLLKQIAENQAASGARNPKVDQEIARLSTALATVQAQVKNGGGSGR